MGWKERQTRCMRNDPALELREWPTSEGRLPKHWLLALRLDRKVCVRAVSVRVRVGLGMGIRMGVRVCTRRPWVIIISQGRRVPRDRRPGPSAGAGLVTCRRRFSGFSRQSVRWGLRRLLRRLLLVMVQVVSWWRGTFTHKRRRRRRRSGGVAVGCFRARGRCRGRCRVQW